MPVTTNYLIIYKNNQFLRALHKACNESTIDNAALLFSLPRQDTHYYIANGFSGREKNKVYIREKGAFGIRPEFSVSFLCVCFFFSFLREV